MKRSIICVVGLATLLSSCGGGGGGSAPTNAPPPVAGNLTGTLQTTNLVPATTPSATPGNFKNFLAFESGQVRPLAMSADGSQLFAVNTPDARLEVFDINDTALDHAMSIDVGMEPVAVAVSGQQVWVVNHLSDSVSVIDMSRSPPRVVRTLLVGDEPRDIVFAGPDLSRAFISTAHRGQHSDVDPQLNTAGVGRADVWVFSRDQTGARLGGQPETIVTLFGDTPRALAVSADGSKVYAAVFNSGNRTTVVRDIPTSSKAPPFASADGVAAPLSGYILKFDGSNWVDETGRAFNQRANLNLPDLDVFEIDAMASTPTETSSWRGVGTTLFNMVVNPVNGNVYVSNTDARNDVRFEGPGNNASSVRGDVARSRVSVLSASGNVVAAHLNSHVDRTRAQGTAAERASSLALPLDMAISRDGQSLYVAAMGSNKLAIIATEPLDSGTFDPAQPVHIEVSGGGPTGVLLDELRQQVYVHTRYDNGLSVVDVASATEVTHVTMFNPEPPSITDGRRFLYDASLTSSTGDVACASCHMFGDTDHLAWDLGNPDTVEKRNPFSPVPLTTPPTGQFITRQPNFHPMKGPKATQSMRGLANHGPMHWRGDRTGAVRPAGEPLEEAAFKEFNEAFDLLLGRETLLDDDQMQAFTDFAMQLRYPPNPHRAIDNSLTPDQNEGRRVYLSVFTSPGGTVGCNTCHVLDPLSGRFGTAVNFSAVLAANEQDFKVPHFRNIYQKVGFFRRGLNVPQIRGFGLSEPGSSDGLLALVNSGEFQFEDSQQPAQLASFIFAFDTLVPPIVGQQVTLSADSPTAAEVRIDVMHARATIDSLIPECDLIVKGVWDGVSRGAALIDGELFQTDRADEQLTLTELKTLGRQSDHHLTFTCAPPNSGERMGVDRNADGVLDGV